MRPGFETNKNTKNASWDININKAELDGVLISSATDNFSSTSNVRSSYDKPHLYVITKKKIHNEGEDLVQKDIYGKYSK